MTLTDTTSNSGCRYGLAAAVFAAILLAGIIPVHAQTPQYSFGNGISANNIPFNPAVFPIAFQKHQGFYSAGLFTGAPAGFITRVYWQRGTTSTATTYANAAFFLEQSTQTTFPTTQFFSPMTQCFFAASHSIPAGVAGQWFSIQLQTPFYYDPGKMLITQFCSDGMTSGGGINIRNGSAVVPYSTSRIWGGLGCNGSLYNYQIDSYQNFGFDIVPGQLNDAGVSALLSPVNFCSGTHPLQINVKNHGANTINTVTINWTYDGVPQTPVIYNTPIPSSGDAVVTLASRTFATGVPHTLRAWTSMPNNVADTSNLNDTLVVTLLPENSGAIVTAGGPTSFCAGGSVSLSANTGTGLTYKWLKDLVEISGATSPGYTATQAGSYRVIVTNATPCSDTSSATVVTILPSPGASITAAGPTSFCAGGIVVLNANTGTGLTYKWLRDLTEINGATSPGYTATQAGSYRVIVTNSSNCSDTSVATVVTILPTPGANITPGGPTTFCAGGSVLLAANTGSGLSYTWLKDGIAVTGATTASYSATQAGSYRVVVTNASPCSDTSSATVVTILSSPGANITPNGPLTFCAGGSVLLNANTGPGLTYKWLKDGVAIPGAVSSGYTATQTGSYRVVVTNASPCSDTSSATQVTIIPSPGASITASGPTAFCEGGSVLLNANTGTGLSYTWLKDGSAIPGATASSYMATQAGSYRVIVTNTSPCSDTSTVTVVTVSTGPGASITAGGPTVFCSGASVVLTANAGAGLSYTWLRDGSVISGAISQSYTAKQEGSYRVIVTLAASCSDTSAATVVTILQGPGASITAAGPTSFCAGGSVELNANTGTGLSYTWLKNGGVIPGATAVNYTVTESGDYRVVVTGASPCSDTSSTIVVTITGAPGADITAGGPTTFCAGGSVVLNANTGAGFTYRWQKDGVDIPAATNAGYLAMQAGSYRVIVTNTGNCSDTSAAVTVVIHDAPTVSAGADVVICAGGSTVIGQIATGGAGPYLYRWNPAEGLSNAFINQPTASPSVTTLYILTVSDANGCAGRDSVTVTVRRAPLSEITPVGPITLCSGDSVELSAPPGMSTYNWLPNGETSRTIVVKSAGSYTVEVTDGFGCQARSQPVQVSVSGRPSSVIAGPVAVCPNSEARYEVPAESAVQYAWVVTNGTILSGASTASLRVRWGASGFGIVQVTVTNPATGCSSSEADTVQIRSTLQPKILPVRPAICAGGSVELDAGPGYASYAWSSGQTTRTITARNAGRYIVTVDDGSGCSGSDTVDVIELPPLQASVDIIGATMFCEGENATLRTREQYVRYRWLKDGAPTGDTVRSIIVASSGRYVVEVEDANGCIGASSETVITVHPRPQAGIIGPASACVQSELGYNALPTTGYSHEWLVTGGTIESGQGTGSIRVRWSSVGSALAQLIVRATATGCADTTDLTVTISQGYSPQITVMGDSMLCEGDTVLLEADAGYETYEWSTGEKTQRITVTAAGTYQVIVADSSCEGQSHPVTVVMLPKPSPVIVPSGPTTICAGDSLSLSLGQSYAAYLWSTGETSPSITVRDGGAYRVTVTNAAGCEGQSEQVVISVQTMIAPQISGPPGVCVNETARYEVPLETGLSYQWTVSGPGTIQSGQGTNIVMVRWTGQGMGTVELMVTDNASTCTARTSITVEVSTVLTPSIITEGRTVLCAGETTILRAPAGYQSYLWSTGETSESIVVSRPGSYTVTVRSAGGCSGTSTAVTITQAQSPAPLVTTTDATMFCVGDSSRLDAGEGYATYLWWRDTQPVGVTERYLTVSESGNYSVTVTNGDGCEATSPPLSITVFQPIKPVITQTGTQLRSTAAQQYQWFVDDTLIAGATEREYIAQRSGTYIVKTTDSNGCVADSDPLNIQMGIASSVITIPRLTATPGQVLRIPIILESSQYLEAAGVRSFTGTVSFNRTLLHPLSAPFSDQGERRRVQVSGQYTQPSGTLVELECMALLGDREITDVTFEDFAWDQSGVQVSLAPGEVHMDLCLEGGTRLYYSTGQTLLKQNWPNPFNAMTMIEYEVIEQATMQLFVTDMNGRRVATLVDGPMPPGRYLAGFDASGLASGQYLYILQTFSERIVKIMEVIK
jgi:large repetitive protein